MNAPQPKTRASHRLLFNSLKALGAVMVVMFAVVMWPLVTGGDKMQEFCAGITSDLTRTAVLDIARVEGYDVHAYESDDAQLDMIVDRRAMGRYVCEVMYLEGRVESARYVLND